MPRLETDNEIRRAMAESSVLAVIGMKPPGQGPAWSVPKYMREQGYQTLPVNPKYEEIGAFFSVPTVDQVTKRVDMVVIFRRSEHIDAHATEILRMRPAPKVVWMQLGIRNERAADRLIEAGIDVVQDRCLAIEHPRLIGRR